MAVELQTGLVRYTSQFVLGLVTQLTCNNVTTDDVTYTDHRPRVKWPLVSFLISVQSAMKEHGVVPDVIDAAPADKAQVSLDAPFPVCLKLCFWY
jgi:hypothetical protein